MRRDRLQEMTCALEQQSRIGHCRPIAVGKGGVMSTTSTSLL
eukprot:CAMPEP_0180642906 /NCGR_PEP_ID=MMETSP1037_2-20121125/47482_1 /TAXON_ID=632150 /ORGANISM="Azadinium spinosum, Strain 3D9" /LENGTH=41 /DNA_ID= /DNA_START= /DNA_END= /DNA_ORIENTATION=